MGQAASNIVDAFESLSDDITGNTETKCEIFLIILD